MPQIQYGQTTIQYQLTYAPRKTLAIDVHPDLTVTVTAPEGRSPEAVAARVRRRAPWILRQQRELELYLPQTPPRQYRSGETHYYLGRQYRLKILDTSEAEPVEAGLTTAETVKLTRGFLTVKTADKQNTSHIQHLVEEWYRKQAHRVLPQRLDAMLPRFASIGPLFPTIKIRKMQTRWGSATDTGTITLNLKLMQVAKPSIDYVIVHELCHLAEHNHSAAFYSLLDRMMPDWRTRRQQLNQSDFS